MSNNKYQVAKRYGKALFQLAEEEQELDAVFHDVSHLRQQLVAIPELIPFLRQTSIEWPAKKVVLDELATEYTETVKKTLAVIGENRRLAELIVILDEYETRYNEAKGIIKRK